MCVTFPRIETNRRGGGGDRHRLIRANFLTGPIWNSKRSFSELGRELTLEIYDHLAPKKSAGSRVSAEYSRERREMWGMENGQRYQRSEAKKMDGREGRRSERKEKYWLGEITRVALLNSLTVKGVCVYSRLSIDEICRRDLTLPHVFIDPLDRREGRVPRTIRLCLGELSWEERKELVYATVFLSKMDEHSEIIKRKL